MGEKSFFDYVSDWFKILLKSGIPAFLIGLGWLSIFFGSIWLGTTWNSGAGFWVLAGSGIMMILLGAWFYKRELDNPTSD
jgi:hypothetical protein